MPEERLCVIAESGFQVGMVVGIAGVVEGVVDGIAASVLRAAEGGVMLVERLCVIAEGCLQVRVLVRVADVVELRRAGGLARGCARTRARIGDWIRRIWQEKDSAMP